MKYVNGYSSPHQRLADQSASTTLGGVFSRGPNGEIYTSENSGHYGKNWTPELRTQFVEVMKKYGFEVKHVKWR